MNRNNNIYMYVSLKKKNFFALILKGTLSHEHISQLLKIKKKIV